MGCAILRFVTRVSLPLWMICAIGALSCGESDSSGQGDAAGGTGAVGGTAGAGAVGGSGGSGGGTAGTGAGAAGGTAGSGAAGGSDGCPFQVGWTHDVRGGLDGDVIRVTTLERDGPGSIGEALEAEGPRVIVFEVGGVIDLGTETLRIRNPFVTIAGQTAPSPGITFIRGSVGISTHDVVLQHIRVRPGEAGQDVGWEPDGISLSSAHDVVVDHCSVTWAIDENLTASGPRFEGSTPDAWRENTSHRVSFIHNIVAEALSESTHSKGEHSKGSLIHDNATDIFIWGNLYASNVDRNPLFKGGARGVVANNLIANPLTKAVSFGLVESEWEAHPHQVGRMAIAGNVFHFGPNTSDSAVFFRVRGPLEVFLDDNLTVSLSGQAVPLISGDTTQMEQLASPPTWPPGFSAWPSSDVVQRVEQSAGARPWDRDEVDARIVEQAVSGTGAHIDHETEGGGYPEHAPTAAAFEPAAWDACFERID